MTETALPSLPRVEIFDHVEGALGDSLATLEDYAREALAPCVAQPAQQGAVPLALLERVEISVIDDAAIAAVHGEFMDDPTATDVITFHHGEILVSYDTARERAAEIGHETLRELLLYVIHGLLHLNGHDDHETAERQRMHRIQDGILDAVWPLPESSKQ